MSINSESLSEGPSALQQRRQATVFLLRLQWLVIFLLIVALLWVYISQQRFQHHVNERLQSHEQVVSRLDEMDDRLFALSQQTLPEPSSAASSQSQAQNQLDLLRLQMQAAGRLLADNNDSAAIDLLRGLHWQLSQSSNEIAPALTLVIKQNLVKDIERLQARSAQPSPWQLQNLAIQNIQDFLHSHEQAMNASAQSKNSSLTRRQLAIHEVIMTLNLASQASNMREQEQLIGYLRQAREQLQTLIPQTLTPQTLSPQESASQAATAQTSTDNNVQTKSSPTNITEVIDRLDRLIANAPKPTPLLTTQILDRPQR
ncbi:hypothetical protein [Psychrobacter aquaticus]|uniref:Uncharacterized protein n=1 Tax=Psychrobacter aquaticus CMS 56 TaxID=1354303 RepID=U4T3D6_9GAMM|nr:hypothetical protein [Psychrobacter aquaticus]ERL55712.1 hypothetical protein M917_1449 [Psychrobacter aquaticus CMS 56]